MHKSLNQHSLFQCLFKKMRLNVMSDMIVLTELDLINNEMMTMAEITAFIKLSDKWIYKQISLGKFPKQTKFGSTSRWFKSEVLEWLNARIVESRHI